MISKSDIFKAKRFESRLMLAHYDKVMERIDTLRLRAGKRRLDATSRKPDKKGIRIMKGLLYFMGSELAKTGKPDTPPGDDLQ